jgi:DNA ligase D-like protein (predicted 3'-phosphoesterase)
MKSAIARQSTSTMGEERLAFLAMQLYIEHSGEHMQLDPSRDTSFCTSDRLHAGIEILLMSCLSVAIELIDSFLEHSSITDRYSGMSPLFKSFALLLLYCDILYVFSKLLNTRLWNEEFCNLAPRQFISKKTLEDTMSLKQYTKKRDLDRSPEPDAARTQTDGHAFVIQKHAASHLHYDFRIEADGVLKSWAVPKGPSTDPSIKRLAIQVEDHPVDYKDFEGVIPEGYGAGTVMIWDKGTYENAKDKSIPDCIDDGHVHVRLHGEKISGGYHLIHTDRKNWLLRKEDDKDADARRNPVSTENKSTKTGRTMHQIKKEAEHGH